MYIRDLYKYKFIFLQHGIIKDDLSEWLNKFNKNLHMFVTSTDGSSHYPQNLSFAPGDACGGKIFPYTHSSLTLQSASHPVSASGKNGKTSILGTKGYKSSRPCRY